MRKLFALILLGASFQAFAQSENNYNQCLTDHLQRELIKANPSLAAKKVEFQNQVAHFQPAASKKAAVYVIPVVFHVIHTYGTENISKAQIEDQIRILNEDYRRLNADASKTRPEFAGVAVDCGIQFKLATIDPDGNCTDGINRIYSPLTDGGNESVKPLSRWDNKKYLNIWVIKNIADTDADPTTRTLGYAYLPWSAPKSLDGIVVRADEVGSIEMALGKKGRTLTHEVGHYLGLNHTFEGGCNTGDCSTTGDDICDTPPNSGPSFGCDKNKVNCLGDLVMIENYMDYADGACMNMFTADQKSVFTFVLESSSYRQTLVSDANAIATGISGGTPSVCIPKPDFYSKGSTTCAGKSINFFDVSWKGEATSRTWRFEGGSPATSGVYNPTVTYSTPGTYKVTLVVSNSAGSDSLVKAGYITVEETVGDKSAPLVQDFEDNSFTQDNWKLSDPLATARWRTVSGTSYSGNTSIKASVAPAGAVNSFTTPTIDLSELQGSPKLYFYYAYAQSSSSDADALRVMMSEDCGATWTQRLSRVGINLSTVSGFHPGFTPSSASEWKLQSYPMSAYVGKKNVMIRFDAISDNGNPIFIDAINIDSKGLGINDPKALVPQFSVYPNPATQEATISYELAEATNVQVVVIDVYGREVMRMDEGKQQPGSYELPFNTSMISMPAAEGIYFIKLQVNNNQLVQKLVLLSGSN